MIVTNEILQLGLLVANDVIGFEGHIAAFRWADNHEIVIPWHYTQAFHTGEDRNAKQVFLDTRRLLTRARDTVASVRNNNSEALILSIEALGSLQGALILFRSTTPFSRHELWLARQVALLINSALLNPWHLELLRRLHLAFIDGRVFPRSAAYDDILSKYVDRAAGVIHPAPFEMASLAPASVDRATWNDHSFRCDGKVLSVNETELRIAVGISYPPGAYTQEKIKKTRYVVHQKDSIAARVILEHSPFWTNRLDKVRNCIRLFPDSKCHMSAPILDSEIRQQAGISLPQCLGVLTCETTLPNAYKKEEMAALTLLAAHSAWPLGRAKLSAEVDRITLERKVVLDASKFFQDCSTLKQVLESIKRTFRSLKYARGLVCEVSREDGVIRGIESWGGAAMKKLCDKTTRSLHASPGDCQCLAVAKLRPIVIKSPYDDPRVDKQALDVGKLRHFAVVPIVNSHSNVDFTLHVEREDTTPISESSDIPLLVLNQAYSEREKFEERRKPPAFSGVC